MGKNKLKKFSELATFPNVYQNHKTGNLIMTDHKGQTLDMKGKWNTHHFKNNNPITLELACGRGEYTVQLARKFPDRNFIGIDVKGARIWEGAKMALEEELDNAAFARMRIETINSFFDKNEIDEVWITFPDPFLRKSKFNRRLTSGAFLQRFRGFLKEDGVVHLKTDEPNLYEFSLEVIEEQKHYLEYNDDDIYAKELPIPELSFKTYYERMHLENKKTIKYIRLKLNQTSNYVKPKNKDISTDE